MKKQIVAVSLLALGLGFSPASGQEKTTELTLVGYGVAKPVFAKIIPAFKAYWKEKTGEDVNFKESYGPSGAQTRAILGGLEADVLATNVQAYVDPLVEKGLISKDWAKKFPNHSSPASSVIVLVIRKGNPKQILGWTDVVKSGVDVVAINPQTSGNARWGIVGGYLARGKAGDAFVSGLVKNTSTLSNSGREATDAFVKNQIGDVLLTFENEAVFIVKSSGSEIDYIVPNENIRVDFPVVVVDKNVDKKGTRKVAEAFTKFLFEKQGQEIYATEGYRPFDHAIFEANKGRYGAIKKLYTIDDIGGWSGAETKLFQAGALYDKAQSVTNK